MNERIKELMEQTGVSLSMPFDKWCEKFAELVAAQERKFIAEQWEKRYSYDKNGVAEFIRKRANTQEEQT